MIGCPAQKRRELDLQRKKDVATGAAGGSSGAAAAAGGAQVQQQKQQVGEQKEFDDLIHALRSGDVFGKDIDKMRRKKKK